MLRAIPSAFAQSLWKQEQRLFWGKNCALKSLLTRARSEAATQPVARTWVLPNVTVTFYYGNYCLYHYEDSRNVT